MPAAGIWTWMHKASPHIGLCKRRSKKPPQPEREWRSVECIPQTRPKSPTHLCVASKTQNTCISLCEHKDRNTINTKKKFTPRSKCYLLKMLENANKILRGRGKWLKENAGFNRKDSSPPSTKFDANLLSTSFFLRTPDKQTWAKTWISRLWSQLHPIKGWQTETGVRLHMT